MGNFEKNIPKHIEEVEKTIQKYKRELWNLDRGHDCNCEFCDAEGEGADPELEEKEAGIEQKIHEARNTIEKLKSHAKVNGVKI